jgi:pyridinium-3,5-biscarboxylic acid mononucleotide sulfurtransferase
MERKAKHFVTTGRKMEAIVDAMALKDGLVVAFSGGVDSTLLARLAFEALGKRAVAVTADSEVVPRSELKEAKALARKIGITHIIVQQHELEDEKVASNPKDRCYYCRKGLAKLLKAVAKKKKFKVIADGVNYSDLGEHRPGIRAANEAGIWHPFIELKVTKLEIRAMAKALSLPIYNKPAAACLSSRIPYGQRITKEKLGQIEKAEALLKKMGLDHVRVRHHGDIARIEVPPELFKKFHDMKLRQKVTTALKKLGFRYVAVDLQGYRSGSMDEVLLK